MQSTSPFPASSRPGTSCALCGKVEAAYDYDFTACMICRRVHYCSVHCKRTHAWAHRPDCGPNWRTNRSTGGERQHRMHKASDVDLDGLDTGAQQRSDSLDILSLSQAPGQTDRQQSARDLRSIFGGRIPTRDILVRTLSPGTHALLHPHVPRTDSSLRIPS